MRTGRLRSATSFNQILGAENLVRKAALSLSAGDMGRAERLIERAARMPYDSFEEGSPGVRGATMVVYYVVTDQLESSHSDDAGWLRVALSVYPALDYVGQTYVASLIHGFVLQEDWYDVTPTEARRIRKLFGDAPLEAELGDSPDVTFEQRRDIIRSLAQAAAALTDAYAAAAGDG